MLTLNVDYEVLPDRLVIIKLPDEVRLGRHQLVIVLDENDRVLHAELVDDITHEPNYDAALAVLK